MRVRLATQLAVVCLLFTGRPGLAQVGGDPGSGGVGREVLQVGDMSVTYRAPTGTGGNPADPDSFDTATSSGSYTVTLSGSGVPVSAPGAVGSCTPTSDSNAATLDLPSMWIRTSPPAPVDGGLGGVVDIPTWAGVTGYRGGTVSGPVAHIRYTTCVLTPGVPPRISSREIEHTAQLSYSSGAPTWDWNDSCASHDPNCAFVGEWGDPEGSSVNHTYAVSSLGLLDVPYKGPSYIIHVHVPVTVLVSSDIGSTPLADPEDRYRVFPVRQVQSVLTTPDAP